MRRAALALTLWGLTGCDAIAGRTLGPAERCVRRVDTIIVYNVNGDSVTTATMVQCVRAAR